MLCTFRKTLIYGQCKWRYVFQHKHFFNSKVDILDTIKTLFMIINKYICALLPRKKSGEIYLTSLDID